LKNKVTALVASLPMAFLLPVLLSGADPRLLDAVRNRDHAAVRDLLRNHADVNVSQPDGSTALLLAADRTDAETVDLLIRAGANVNTRNDYGASPLYAACTTGDTTTIKLLLEAKADPNALLMSGESPLMAAIDKANPDAVRLLLDYKANVNSRESRGGQTALMWAAAGRQPQLVKLLVEHGADVGARSKGDFTALLFAAQQGAVESGRALLEAGAEVNAIARKDRLTPLILAAAGGHNEFAVLLLDKGANPDLMDEGGRTALHLAALDARRVELVKALLAHGANPNPRTTKDSPRNLNAGVSFKGATPLFFAASRGNIEGVRALIAGGADPFITTDEKTAPLHVAAWGGSPGNRDWTEEEKRKLLAVVRVLVDLGADVNSAGEHQWTALHGAAYKGVDAVVQFLVEKGAKMDIFDEYGQTPLSIASAVTTAGLKDYYYQRSQVLRQNTADLLLKLGATPLAQSGIQTRPPFYKEP
jgi:ankyrin repeat protein